MTTGNEKGKLTGDFLQIEGNSYANKEAVGLRAKNFTVFMNQK